VIEDVFVITGKQFSATQNGKHFIKAFLSDRTTQVTARMWNATREIFSAMPESGFLRVRGRVENYQNNLQFIIEQLWPAKPGTFDIGDLVPKTDKDVADMFGRVERLLGSVRNRHLKALLDAYLGDAKLMDDFRRAPAAMSFHHAYLGGLLEHTLNALEVADTIAPLYPRLNRDVVLAGIFLHDLAKTWELTYECSFGYSDGGQLIGHIAKGAMWVEDKARQAQAQLGEPIPRSLIDVIEHIILSHHGQPEFGAARIPSTPEAIAVHMIEDMDAKLMMALGATRGEPKAGAEGNWTEYMKAFSGRLYRPDVAPPDGNGAAAGPPEPMAAPLAVTTPPATPAPEAAAPEVDRTPAAPVKMAITNPLFEAVPGRKK